MALSDVETYVSVNFPGVWFYGANSVRGIANIRGVFQRSTCQKVLIIRPGNPVVPQGVDILRFGLQVIASCFEQVEDADGHGVVLTECLLDDPLP